MDLDDKMAQWSTADIVGEEDRSTGAFSGLSVE